MGDGVAVFIWLIFFGVYCAAWMAAFGAYWVGRDEGSKILKWLGGVPLAALTLFALGCIGFAAFTWVRSTNPICVFEWQFHQRPTADVKNLKSSYWRFAESERAFLSFQTNPESFRRILPQRLRRIEVSEYRKRTPLNGLQPPLWWCQPTEAASEIYFANSIKGMGGSFYEETTLITFEPSTGNVMYFFLGID